MQPSAVAYLVAGLLSRVRQRRDSHPLSLLLEMRLQLALERRGAIFAFLGRCLGEQPGLVGS